VSSSINDVLAAGCARRFQSLAAAPPPTVCANAYSLIQVHMLSGIALVLALWIQAAVSVRQAS